MCSPFLLSRSNTSYGTIASFGNFAVVKFFLLVVFHMEWRFSSWLDLFCISIGLLKNLISRHAHVLSHVILNIHGRPSNGWSPIEGITLPDIFLATNKSFYFNRKWFLNSAPPFTIPTNTLKFASSTACILNVGTLLTPPRHLPVMLLVFPITPALSLTTQTFSRPPAALTILYSPSLHLAAALMLVLPLYLSLLPLGFLPWLYYIASRFLPSAPSVVPVMFYLPCVHCPLLAT